MATPSQPQLFRCMGRDEQCRLMYTPAVSCGVVWKKQPEGRPEWLDGDQFLEFFNTHLEHDNSAKVSKRQEDDHFLAIMSYIGMNEEACDVIS